MTTLAFLSGISDNKNHVTAVSLEELPAQRGYKVMLAINKRVPQNSQQTLDSVQRGFERILGKLRTVSPSRSHCTVLSKGRFLYS